MANNSEQPKRLGWLTIVLVVVSIVLCVPNFIMIADIFQTSNNNHETNEGVCIKADILDSKYLETKDGQSFFHLKTDNGKQSYCIKSANDLTNFLISYQKSLEKSKADKQTKRNLTVRGDANPTGSFSVHVPLISSIPLIETASAPKFDNSSKYPLHLDTKNIGVTGEIVDNFVVTSTGIIIKYSGMYHVYSNVLFDPNSGVKCDEFPIKNWRHDVVRASPNDRQRSGTILTSLYICCDECTLQRETSHAGGIFLLEAGDHLHVEVSAFGLTRFDKAASYMGLFLLGNPE